jgi:hypothetical protein
MLARPRPTPTMCRARPARLSAAATEPPIKPTPITTSLSQLNSLKKDAQCSRKLSSYSLQYDCERRQEALILGFGTDGHPKVFRQAIGSNRPHDDPMLEQSG